MEEGAGGEEAAQRDRAVLASLLIQVGDQDRLAFRKLYDRTSAKLFGVCLRILSERHEAEEALQDAFLTIWQKASSYDAARGSAMVWLITVTRNRTLDRLRGMGRLAALPIEVAEGLSDPSPSIHATLADDEEEARLAGCMEGLDTGDARLIRASFIEGSSYSILACRAGQPLGTIKSRIRRALLKLRACLQ